LPKIDRHPAPASWGCLTRLRGSIPHFDPARAASNSDQVDLRGCDLRKLDLRKSAADLYYADFDMETKWPSADRMPAGFDPRRILEIGKNPGLGVRRLHARGITGRGVGIAIIDQPLLVDHREYAARLRLYEEINVRFAAESEMHGPAVASIAVGKTVGVAPGADLYYIADYPGTFKPAGGFVYDFGYLAKGIRRILAINRGLPGGHKIRVISISLGWMPGMKGYEKITRAVNEARRAGVFVVSTSESQIYGFNLMGMGRSPLSDPDKRTSYGTGLFWAGELQAHPAQVSAFLRRTLLAPMDSRATADPKRVAGYAFYREGGLSWSIPYVAGVYALAAQVDPAITPERFWRLALSTGKTIELERAGANIRFGRIIDPPALIEALQR
jgi:hypothetical protein